MLTLSAIKGWLVRSSSLAIVACVCLIAAPTSAAPSGPPEGHRYAGAPMTQHEVKTAVERESAIASGRATGGWRGANWPSVRLHRSSPRRSSPHRSASVQKSVERHLKVLTSDPHGRDPMQPGFSRMARYAAATLQQAGFLPAGSGRWGRARYFQRVAWESPYAEYLAPGSSKTVRSKNVLAIRRGDGSTDESILVLVHNDGLSTGLKNWLAIAANPRLDLTDFKQAANDNASGVSAALTAASLIDQAIKKQGAPLKRHVVIAVLTGEEDGLKGSEALVRFSKHFGNVRFVAAVNLDAVGGGGVSQINIYGGANAREAEANHVFRRAANQPYRGDGIKPSTGMPHRGLWNSLDSYSTALAGIPSISYVGPLARIHTPDDTLEHLNTKTIARISEHVTDLVVSLANEPGRIEEGTTLPVDIKTYQKGRLLFVR